MELSKLSSSRQWVGMMAGVPADRISLFREMKDKLGITISNPIKISDTELEERVKKFERGMCHHSGRLYTYRLSRIPYHVEWKIEDLTNGSLIGHILQDLITFDSQTLEESRRTIQEVMDNRAVKGLLEFKHVVNALASLPGGSAPVPDTMTIGESAAHQIRSKTASMEKEILDFLESKGLSKDNLQTYPVPVAQLLAALFDDNQIESPFLALTWYQYDNDKQLQERLKTEAAKKARVAKRRRHRENLKVKRNAERSMAEGHLQETELDDEDDTASPDGAIEGLNDPEAEVYAIEESTACQPASEQALEPLTIDSLKSDKRKGKARATTPTIALEPFPDLIMSSDQEQEDSLLKADGAEVTEEKTEMVTPDHASFTKHPVKHAVVDPPLISSAVENVELQSLDADVYPSNNPHMIQSTQITTTPAARREDRDSRTSNTSVSGAKESAAQPTDHKTSEDSSWKAGAISSSNTSKALLVNSQIWPSLISANKHKPQQQQHQQLASNEMSSNKIDMIDLGSAAEFPSLGTVALSSSSRESQIAGSASTQAKTAQTPKTFAQASQQPKPTQSGSNSAAINTTGVSTPAEYTIKFTGVDGVLSKKQQRKAERKARRKTEGDNEPPFTTIAEYKDGRDEHDLKSSVRVEKDAMKENLQTATSLPAISNDFDDSAIIQSSVKHLKTRPQRARTITYSHMGSPLETIDEAEYSTSNFTGNDQIATQLVEKSQALMSRSTNDSETAVPFPVYTEQAIEIPEKNLENVFNLIADAKEAEARRYSIYDRPIAPLRTVSAEMLTAAARTVRADSMERLRRGLQRRLSSPSLPPIHRERISSIGGIDTPYSLGHSSVSSEATDSVVVSSKASEMNANPGESKSTNRRSRILVAVPDIKLLNRDRRRSESDKSKQTLVKSNEDLKKRSDLRAEAPSFVPQAASALASPDLLAYSSVPMSISTSATSFTKSQAAVDNTDTTPMTKKDDLELHINLPSLPAHLTDTRMVYPSDSEIATLKRKQINRPRSKSFSEIPSTTAESFDGYGYTHPNNVLEYSQYEDVVEVERQAIDIWPKFKPQIRPEGSIIYAWHDIGESSAEIFFGQPHMLGTTRVIHNYRVRPFDTGFRAMISNNVDIPMDAAVHVMEVSSGLQITLAQYDEEYNVWRIFPPSILYDFDLRTGPDHPDYLETEKLLIVQGLEAFGYLVYRDDYHVTDCYRKDCTNKAANSDAQTTCCMGCGPLSKTRYCSLHCMFEAIPTHWEECGAEELLPARNIYMDKDISLREESNDLMPMIQDLNGWNSKARYRTHITNYYLKGDYGLYPDSSMMIEHISFKGDTADDMRDRCTRLINCLLLDHRLNALVGYLYLLLRDALEEWQGFTGGENKHLLKALIRSEWDFDWWQAHKYLDNAKACDCMWFGTDNTPSCKDGCGKAGAGFGPLAKGGIKAYVEDLEKDFWILRAWRHTHPNVPDWRERVLGKGFKGVKPRKLKDHRPVLGRGYNGCIDNNLKVGDWHEKLCTTGTLPKTIYDPTDNTWRQDDMDYWWPLPDNEESNENNES